MRVLECQEEAALRSLVRAELGHVLAVEEDLALGHLVRRVPHERIGERRLARPVRTHDRVLLVQVDGKVDTLDDLGAVLERDVQILDLEQCHTLRYRLLRRCTGNGKRRPSLMVADRRRKTRSGTRWYRAPMPFGARLA